MIGPARRGRRQPSLLLAVEAVALVLVLTATSTFTAGTASALGDEGTATPTVPSPTSLPAPTEPQPSSPDPSPVATPLLDPSAAPAATASLDPTAGPAPTVSPEPTPAGPSPAPEPTLLPDPTATPEVTPSPEPTLEPDPTVHVGHVWVDSIDRRTGALVAGALDAPANGLERSRIYVVRFQIVNATADAVEIDPRLQFGLGDAPEDWTRVPAVDPVPGVPFYTSANVLRGQATGSKVIPVGELRLAGSDLAEDLAVPGTANIGLNPGRPIRLGPGEFTELSFTIRATAGAAWLTRYAVRLVDAGVPIDGPAASLRLRGRPPVQLSPGQRRGIPVEEGRSTVVQWPISGTGAAIARSAGTVQWALAATSFSSPHFDLSLTGDSCAACHAAHTADGAMLLAQPAPQATLCLTCHDGTGATADIASQYGDPLVPANDPSTGSYYSHPATSLSSHTSDRDESEFDGLLNRHTACTDCHQPHRADASLSVETAAGWTASGALIGASGVAVTNGAAGASPSYAWQSTSDLEYQLCFKCHSGFTELPAQTGGPSTWALDKAIELNPANASYHPVEAAGTNGTLRMSNSLAGTSPYKLWTFTTTSTVRCVSCHGDPRLANPASPPDPGARLAPHAVANRGMLIANLRDRALKGPSEAYEAADFALCLSCHAEAPFVDTSQDPRADSAFPGHGLHSAAVASFSGPVGGTVDEDGAGHGNALCAECHFRTHGTTYAVDGQDAEPRLVNFAPNVQPYGGGNPALLGMLDWDSATGTCTLTCHGVDHGGWGY